MRSLHLLTAFALLLCGLLAAPAAAADRYTVRGRIEIKNPKVKLRGGAADTSGIVIWLMPLDGRSKLASAKLPRRRIEQREKRFIPHVTAIQVGTEIDFPNNDPFFHNVFSTFDGRTFDLGLYANGESRPVRFNRPGVSYLYCNIHPQMSAVVVTVDTPHFAMTGPDGAFSINVVEPGRYELNVWHERAEAGELASLRAEIPVDSPSVDVGTIGLDEASYIPKAHKNKHGEDYAVERESPYRRP